MKRDYRKVFFYKLTKLENQICITAVSLPGEKEEEEMSHHARKKKSEIITKTIKTIIKMKKKTEERKGRGTHTSVEFQT